MARGYSYENIKHTLRVSSETIARVNIALNHDGEGYKIVVDKILQDRAMKEFWEKIEDVLVSILPPKSDPGKTLRDHKYSRKPKGPLG